MQGTIELIGNLYENVTVPAGADVAIDLAGFTLTNDANDDDAAATIVNNGELVIMDSSEAKTGTVDNVSHAKAALFNEQGATATLQGGSFDRSAEDGMGGSNSYYTLVNHGDMVINEGVEVSQGNPGTTYSSMIENGFFNTSDYNEAYPEPKLTINGGTFTGGLATLKNDEWATLEINGGTFENYATCAITNWNIATINGGTFRGTQGVVANGNYNEQSATGQLTINGGTFAWDKGYDAFRTIVDGYEIGDIAVSGGTFSGSFDEAYVADGFGLYPNEDGTYGILTAKVASIGFTYYETFEAAIAAAQPGETVALLADAETVPVTVSTGITIDLAGHTLTIAGASAQPQGILFVGGTNSITSSVDGGSIIDERTATVENGSVSAIRATGEGTTLTTSNVSIIVTGSNQFNYGVEVVDGADVTIGDGTTIDQQGAVGYTVGIQILGSSDDAASIPYTTKLSVEEGASVYGSAYGISGNGESHGTEIAINGGSVTADAATGIFHPQMGTLTVAGGTITGCTGIEMRSGTLDMTDGTVVATGSYHEYEGTGSGNCIDGAAIAVAQHATKLPIDVNISGGALEGDRAFAQVDNFDDFDPESNNIELSVTGGSFEGEVYSENFTAANGNGFIKGGTYTDDSAEACLVDGYELVGEPGNYGVELADDVVAVDDQDNAYRDFESIIADAPSGSTVTMVADTAISGTRVFATGRELTIDLNGQTVASGGSEGSNSGTLIVRGSLTIKDGSETQAGVIGDAYSLTNLLQVQTGGTLTLESGTIVARVSAVTISAQNASFVMNGGRIEAKNPVIARFAGTVNIQGGTVEASGDYAVGIENAGAHLTIGAADSFDTPQINGAIQFDRAVTDGSVVLAGGMIANVTGAGLPASATLTSHFGSDISNVLPAGYVCVEHDGYWAVEAATAENAALGIAHADGATTYYASLAALNASGYEFADGDILTLLKDATGSLSFAQPGTYVVDLGGHTLTSSDEVAISIEAADANVTVRNGDVVSTSDSENAVIVMVAAEDGNDNVSATFEGVDLSMTDGGAAGIQVYGINENNNITLSNSTLSVPADVMGIYFPPMSGQLVIENSDITAGTGIGMKGGSLTVSGDSSIHATGDKLEPTEALDSGINETGDAIYLEGNYATNRDVIVTIEGGTFTSENGNAVQKLFAPSDTQHRADIEVSGGSFDDQSASEYLARGYELVDNGNGTYGVQEREVARVGDTTYPFVQDAIDAAAQSGGTVVLLADATEALSDEVVSAGEQVTINLNGHVLRSAETTAVAGDLTIIDSTAAGLTVNDSYDVEYEAGKIVGNDIPCVLRVRDGGSLTVESGIVEYDGDDPRASAIIARSGSNVAVNGGYVLSKSFGISVYDAGTTVTVTKGAVEGVERAAISGNGSTFEDGGTAISIEGGYVLGGCTDEGRIATAIYHPQNGTLTVSGGTVYADNGAAIVMRAGTVNVTGGSVIATGDKQGTVEDSACVVSSAAIFYDLEANYPGSKPNQGGVANSVSVTGGTLESDVAPVQKSEPTDESVEYVPAISGGTFSGTFDGSLLAEDYELVSNDDGTYGVQEREIAQVGDETYPSIQDALDAAAGTGVEVTLLKDTVEQFFVAAGQMVTLDLNGKTVTVPRTVGVEGNLTIVDNTAEAEPQVSDDYKSVTYESGTIQSTGDVIQAQNGGTITLKSGTVRSAAGNGMNVIGNTAPNGEPIVSTITVEGGYVHSREYGIGVYGTVGTLNVTGGVIEADDNGAIAGNGSVTESNNQGGTDINISGGTVIGHIVSSGYIAMGIYHPQAGTLDITGGTIYADGGAGIVMRAGELNISDNATVIATGNATGWCGDNKYELPSAGIVYDTAASYPGMDLGENVITITGGFVTSDIDEPVQVVAPETPVENFASSISGGTFSGTFDESLLAEDYELVSNDDGTYGVQIKKVAAIGDTTYPSLEDAVNAAQSGETVMLLEDATVASVVVDDDITIDLGGKTLTVTSGSDNSYAFGIIAETTIKNGTIVDERTKENPDAGNFQVLLVQGVHVDLQDVTIQTYAPSVAANAYNYLVYETLGGSLETSGQVRLEEVYGDETFETSEEYFEAYSGVVGISVVNNNNPDAGTTSVVVNEGTVIDVSSFAMCGNGSQNDNTEIVIAGGKVTSRYASGVYHPQAGTITVSGGTVTGVTGIEMRAGTLNVRGGTIVGSASEFSCTANGNGSTSQGAGVMVAQHTTQKPVVVNIVDGTLQGAKAFAQANPQGNPQEAIDKIELSIEGGTFDGEIYSEDFTAENGNGFISNGTFSSTTAGDYLVYGKRLDQNADGTYGVEAAVWTVTFDPADGSEPSESYVQHEGALSRPADPVREGYVFEGWYVGGAEEPYAFGSPVLGDLELTARWSPVVVSHTVTFDPANGSEAFEQLVADGDAAARPSDPKRDGYVFEGWELGGEPYDFASPVTGDIELVASWSEIYVAETVTVTLDPGYEGAQAGSVVLNSGDALSRPADPVREGYTFLGWFADGATEAYDFATPVTSDLTLTAHWTSPFMQVIEMIEALDDPEDITCADREAVREARAAYEALIDEHKGLVDNYDTLLAVEAALDVALQAGYTDVAGHWAANEGWLCRVTGAGLMSGIADESGATGRFEPDGMLTRGQIVTILYRDACADDPTLEEEYGSTTDPSRYSQVDHPEFSDDTPNMFYTAALAWAYDNGIVTGDKGPDGSTPNPTVVRMEDEVSRQELATLIYRYAVELCGADSTGNTADSYADAPDAAEVMDYAAPAMGWCYYNEVLTGDANTGNLNPSDYATRGEAAKMVVVALLDVLG